MNDDQSTTFEVERLPRENRTYTFTKLFAAVGFLWGGWVVFFHGYGIVHPPPLPPGTAGCGNAVIGAWILMFVGAPLAAIIWAIVLGGVGALVDAVRPLRPMA